MREKQIRPEIDSLLKLCADMLDGFVANNNLNQKDMHIFGRKEFALVDFPCKLQLDYDDGKNVCRVEFDLDFSDSQNEEAFKAKFSKTLEGLLKIINHSKNQPVEIQEIQPIVGGVTGLVERINNPLKSVVFAEPK